MKLCMEIKLYNFYFMYEIQRNPLTMGGFLQLKEKNKEWENFWWTVDEDMFTYVMKSKIEELIDEKLNQEFPEEVEIRENQDFDGEEEMTSETEDTDDDESEPNNANVNNYLDSANVATNLESAMKIAEEDL